LSPNTEEKENMAKKETQKVTFNFHSGMSRRNYVIARTRKTELKKLMEWLKNLDHLDFATHDNPSEVYIFNRTKIDGY
jgi:hypothetical protein